MTPPAIRPVRPADGGRWLALWEAYSGRGALADDEATRVTWERFLDPAEPMSALVAEARGEELAGFAHLVLHRETGSVAPACFLQDLFVSPDVRGRGIGRALIEAACAAAGRMGASHVHWRTRATNPRAMALYDRLAERTDFVQYRRRLGEGRDRPA